MIVNREMFFRKMQSLMPGILSRETVEQTSCIVFTENGKAMSFDEEVLIQVDNPVPEIVGAIKAKPFLGLLSRLTDDEISLERSATGLDVRTATKKKANFRMDSKVVLPVDQVEEPDYWRELDPCFSEAVSLVHSCAGGQESEFELTCVHIHPEWLEASDKIQAARYPMDTGVEEPVLVRAASLKKILGFDMREISETEGWVHFRNLDGVQMSVRRNVKQYYNLSKFLVADGTKSITLPGGLGEGVGRAEIFSTDSVAGNWIIIDLRPGAIIIEGTGPFGNYKEMQDVIYTGDPIKFAISPRIFTELVKKSTEARVDNTKLFVHSGPLLYATSTQVKPVNAVLYPTTAAPAAAAPASNPS